MKAISETEQVEQQGEEIKKYLSMVGETDCLV